MSSILVVEDDPTVAGVVRASLTLGEHQVDVVAAAHDAQERLREDGHDLLIIDINLPGASGIELLRHLRQELGRDTPVIILSALKHTHVIVEALELGADDYMTKPFSPRELLARVKRLTARDE